jgi:hypothetical protein
MIEDYDGADLLDATGERIGTVERSYVDDGGTVRFVEVKMGGLRAKHRLVPADRLERTDDALRAPFGKDVVEASPDASAAGDTLEGRTLDEVRSYYAPGGDEGTGTADETAAQPATEVQPRAASTLGSESDEGMTGKAKRTMEQVREELPGAGSGAGEGQDDAGSIGQVRDLGEVIEVPIVEEELVKRPVVKEVLRIRKSSVTDRQSVGGEVRKEDVEVDR